VLSPVEIALHLRSLPLFDGLTIRQLIDLAGVVREQVRPAGAVITTEGDSEDCLYLIVDGEVRVTRNSTELNRLGPRDFFGEIAVLERLARTATVTATTRVRLLRLDRDDLLRLMEELPVIAICICQTLSKRTRDLSQKVDDLSKQLGEHSQIGS
jgi:CRP-like cAMP-binding protein